MPRMADGRDMPHATFVRPWGRAEPLVDEAIATIIIICRGALMLFYRAALPLSRKTLNHVTGS